MKRYTIATEAETARIAGAVASVLRGGVTLGLSGELGAGKTTFVRYLVTAAGGDPREVASPTYTLQHEYRLPSGLMLEHWDLYRVTTLPLELHERALPHVVRLIEWPERCPEILSDVTCHVRFHHGDSENISEARVLEVVRDSTGEVVSVLDSL